MFTLTLSEEEKAILINLINYSISETHSEIVHSDSFQLKETLKNRKHLLTEMLERLKAI
jgi:hypothetical protein